MDGIHAETTQTHETSVIQDMQVEHRMNVCFIITGDTQGLGKVRGAR